MAKKEVFLSAFLLAAMISVFVLPHSLFIAHAQTGNSPFSEPATEWQKSYGNYTESASNLIQTSDGGYAFMKSGWSYQMTFSPATIYKIDSSGNMQWNKTIPFLYAKDIIQTSDNGYEISGYWSTYGTTYIETPTLVKTDSQANIQWVENYSTIIPNFFNLTYTKIQTSDGGFAFGESGAIVKTDSNNNLQWVKNLTYRGAYMGDRDTLPLTITSLIETNDGSLVGLSVGLNSLSVRYSGSIYLIKTEPFLPLPSQSPLPTPLPNSTPTPSASPTPSPSPTQQPTLTPTIEPIQTTLVMTVVIVVVIATIVLVVLIIVGLMRYIVKSKKQKN
jgi:hypothetical protein